MIDITPLSYQSAIPGCCRLRTYEEHAEELMLCWGLLHQIRSGSEQATCGMCEYNAEPAGDFARIEWYEKQAKERMWNTLKGRAHDYHFLQQSE